MVTVSPAHEQACTPHSDRLAGQAVEMVLAGGGALAQGWCSDHLAGNRNCRGSFVPETLAWKTPSFARGPRPGSSPAWAETSGSRSATLPPWALGFQIRAHEPARDHHSRAPSQRGLKAQAWRSQEPAQRQVASPWGCNSDSNSAA